MNGETPQIPAKENRGVQRGLVVSLATTWKTIKRTRRVAHRGAI